MRRNTSHHTAILTAALTACFASGTGHAYGASATWTGGTGTSWGTDANWNPAAAPGNTDGTATGTFDVATFGVGTNVQVDPDSGRRISQMVFNSQAGNYIIGPAVGANTLVTGTITGNNTSTITFNSAITYRGDGNIIPAAGQTFDFNGVFTGWGGLSVLPRGAAGSTINFNAGIAANNASSSANFRSWTNTALINVNASTSLGTANIYDIAGTLNLNAPNIMISSGGNSTNLTVTTGSVNVNAVNAISGTTYVRSGFLGSGTTGIVTINHDQDYTGRRTSGGDAGRGYGTITGNFATNATNNQSIASSAVPDIGANGFTTATGGTAFGTVMVNNNAANTGAGASHTTGSATGNSDVNIVTGLLGGNGFIANSDVTINSVVYPQGVTLHRRLQVDNFTDLNTVGTTYGELSPGASAGAVGTLTMDLGSKGLNISAAVSDTNTQTLLFDLVAPGSSDEVSLLNTTVLNIGAGGLEFDDFVFNLPTTSLAAGTYTLFDSSQLINGSLGSNLSGTLDGQLSTLSLADGGRDVVLTVVPEPATLGVLAIGGLSLLARRRRSV